MEPMDIHALRVFVEAAHLLSFSEAARSLNLSQPAVSMQMRSLEDYLDAPLFERSPQGISLTRAGQALLPHAEEILEKIADAEESVRATVSRIAGDLVIGCSATAGKYIVPHMVARFQRLYPEVRVSIPVISRHDMIEGVIGGALDLGVTSLRVPGAEVQYREFFTDRLALIVPAAHPWAARGAVEATELASERFICREPESACRTVVGSGLARLGVDMADLDIVMQVGSAEALAMAVEHGIGLAFVSVLAAVPRVALGRLAIVQVNELELCNPIELVTANNRPASAALLRFLDFVAQSTNRSLMQLIAEGHVF